MSDRALDTRISRRDAVGGMLLGTLATGLSLVGTPVQAQTKLVSSKKTDGHPLTPAIKMARESLDALKKVKDYTATFYKEELVGKTRINQQMAVKIREQPFSVYLRFQKELDGREVIYVDGKNEGKFLFHGSGLESVVGTLKFAPDHKKVLEENRYPMNMIGLTSLVKTLVGQWEGELELDTIEVKHFPNAKIGTTECKVYQSTQTKRLPESKFHITRLYVDRATSLPVRTEQLDFPSKAGEQPVIIEQYTYLDLKTNVALTDADFDPKNKNYKF